MLLAVATDELIRFGSHFLIPLSRALYLNFLQRVKVGSQYLQ